MSEWPAFLGAAMLLTLAPGPDNVQVLTRGVVQGRGAALSAAAGFASGVWVHTGLAAAGVALLIQASPWLFALLKWAGAAYLAWLGVMSLRHPDFVLSDAQAGDAGQGWSWPIFRQSVLANVLNPKVTLFFLAFLPQFARPGEGSVAWQMTVLGLLFMLQAWLIFSAIGIFAARLGQRLRQHPAWGRRLNQAAGLIFIGIALRLVV